MNGIIIHTCKEHLLKFFFFQDRSTSRALLFHLKTVWLVTHSDIIAVVIPQMMAGLANASSNWIATSRLAQNHNLTAYYIRLVTSPCGSSLTWINWAPVSWPRAWKLIKP